MNVQAKVLEVGLLITGQSDNGNDWEKQQVVVETLELEPKQLAVDFMGERKTQTTKTLKTGDKVELGFSIRCRKWGDKWFTGLDGHYIKLVEKLDAGEGKTDEQPPEQIPVDDAPDFA